MEHVLFRYDFCEFGDGDWARGQDYGRGRKNPAMVINAVSGSVKLYSVITDD